MESVEGQRQHKRINIKKIKTKTCKDEKGGKLNDGKEERRIWKAEGKLNGPRERRSAKVFHWYVFPCLHFPHSFPSFFDPCSLIFPLAFSFLLISTIRCAHPSLSALSQIVSTSSYSPSAFLQYFPLSPSQTLINSSFL